MNHLLTSLSLSLLAASVPAQSFFMPSNTPSTGTCNSIPFGQGSFIYQTLASAADLGNAAVLDLCEIAFTPCSGAGVVHFDTIEVTFAQTSAGTLGTDFVANLQQNPQVVLKATNHDWDVTANEWNRLGLDKNYLYIAGSHPNLVIQIVATGVTRSGVSTSFHRDGTHQRVYALNWTGSPPATGRSSMAALKFELSASVADVNAFGLGCKGTNGEPTLSVTGDGKLGGSFGINVVNCVANQPLFHVFGLTRLEPAIDLGFAGAPGCFLYTPTDLLLGNVTSTAGDFVWSVGIPNSPSLLCARVYTQIAPGDPTANSFGRTTSNYARLLVGN